MRRAPRSCKAVERIEAARTLTPYTSTQENAWMVLAARALARDTANMALDVAGETQRGPLYRSFRAKRSRRRPVRVTNNGDERRAGGGVGDRRAGDARSPRPTRASRSSGSTTRSTASAPTSPR